ncbi:aspartic proteinase A1-like [Juglans microcarpa x Juglans regia]|uniref:aspartic proteinase A1-like n=1 Tax=Juglans microcarpa x Juglans regia TaxID=2249226 RepID=UPI001B7DC7F5|nr:aspartic proteinase A1-like [Juglans microcarpa x Juglans regia]
MGNSGFFSCDEAEVGNRVVMDQEFIGATREPRITFLVAKFDGILGLGFQENFVRNSAHVWYNMVEQDLVKEQVFSLWLNRKAEEEKRGVTVFGGADRNHYKRKLTSIPMTCKGYCPFEYNSYLFGNHLLVYLRLALGFARQFLCNYNTWYDP